MNFFVLVLAFGFLLAETPDVQGCPFIVYAVPALDLIRALTTESLRAGVLTECSGEAILELLFEPGFYLLANETFGPDFRVSLRSECEALPGWTWAQLVSSSLKDQLALSVKLSNDRSPMVETRVLLEQPENPELWVVALSFRPRDQNLSPYTMEFPHGSVSYFPKVLPTFRQLPNKGLGMKTPPDFPDGFTCILELQLHIFWPFPESLPGTVYRMKTHSPVNEHSLWTLVDKDHSWISTPFHSKAFENDYDVRFYVKNIPGASYRFLAVPLDGLSQHMAMAYLGPLRQMA